MPEQTRETAVLLADEVVVNALKHGRGRVALFVTRDDDQVRVEVEDESPDLPQLVDLGPLSDRGRGLRLVDELSASWGTAPPESPAAGKRVWFEV